MTVPLPVTRPLPCLEHIELDQPRRLRLLSGQVVLDRHGIEGGSLPILDRDGAPLLRVIEFVEMNRSISQARLDLLGDPGIG